MKEKYQLPQNEKKEFVFRTGGDWLLKIVGIMAFLIGLWVFRISKMPGDSYEGSPAIGYLISFFLVLSGVGVFFYKSEKRFDLLSRRWQVLKSVLCIKKHREGVFEDFSAVEVDCNSSADSGLPPYTYEVKLIMRDGHYLSIRQGFPFARQALSIANELSKKLSLPLKDKTSQSNIIELIPPYNAPEPSHRLSTSSFDGDTVTFLIPAATKLDKKYLKSKIIGWSALSAPLIAISIFAMIAFWDWLGIWYHSGDITDLKKAFFAFLFMILPILAVYVIFIRALGGKQILKAGPSGITQHYIYDSSLLDKKFSKDKITAIITRLNTHVRPPGIEDIVIFSGIDTILVGQGLPDEEKTWIASQLCHILGLPRSDVR